MDDEAKYIGLMSGTSVDSIDTALVSISNNKVKVLAYSEYPVTSALRNKIEELCLPGPDEIDHMGELDRQLGLLFAEATLDLLAKQSVPASAIRAIGSHGQTIRHRPNLPYPFTLQIGDPSTIAFQTGITTVAHFRAKDIAGGGQGAPLTPTFHNAQFSTEKPRVVLNMGGIANISRLSSAKTHLLGFDTGPANTLMDAWIKQHCQQNYDQQGNWAKSGHLHTNLLSAMLAHPYFEKAAPKSTGREEFSIRWLNDILSRMEPIAAHDVQRTLCEFTALTISQAMTRFAPECTEIILCGGGSKNSFLVERLQALLPEHRFDTTDSHGIPVDAVEAAAFAWLAHRTLHSLTGNCASVTGARHDLILGGIYQAN